MWLALRRKGRVDGERWTFTALDAVRALRKVAGRRDEPVSIVLLNPQTKPTSTAS